jgi:hypothetical protein
MPDLQGLHVELQLIASMLLTIRQRLIHNKRISRGFMKCLLREVQDYVEAAQLELLRVVDSETPCPPPEKEIPF